MKEPKLNEVKLIVTIAHLKAENDALKRLLIENNLIDERELTLKTNEIIKNESLQSMAHLLDITKEEFLALQR